MNVEKKAEVKMAYKEFINQMSLFSSICTHKDVHESVVDFKVCKLYGEDGASIFFSDARIKETVRIAYFIPFSKTLYKTRRIIFRPEENGEVKISLHEIFQRPSEADESKKRKFRFYIKEESLCESFLFQCQKYLLHRISNNDVIRSIEHAKTNGLEL